MVAKMETTGAKEEGIAVPANVYPDENRYRVVRHRLPLRHQSRVTASLLFDAPRCYHFPFCRRADRAIVVLLCREGLRCKGFKGWRLPGTAYAL